MAKFKVGDRLKCIKSNLPTAESHGGSGWREDKIITVSRITDSDNSIYWPTPGEGENDAGVYENWLEKVTNPSYPEEIETVVRNEVKRLNEEI